MTLARPLTALAAALLALSGTPAAAAEQRPNFLIIVADDLGFSDLGAFGGEIATPNLDKLALGGLRLTGFHTAPTCSPTRSMLLSGTDNHLAGLGSMAETLAPNQKGQPGFEGYLRPDVASLAERFKAGGYRTLYSGKWHLGLTPEQNPAARGFERSFAMLQGAHNHFGNDLGQGATYTKDGKILTALPGDFYSSDNFASELIAQVKESSGAKGKKPFFAYLAFTAPHWPLQARPEDIAKYKGRYDAGFDVLRAARLKKQAELGLISPNTVAHTSKIPRGHWDSLTATEKKQAARDMEIYAAMVDRLDQNVGRVIEALKASGELDNTVILFLADNGAEGLDLEGSGLALLGPRLARAKNEFDNRGAASSYVAYGPGWAHAATAPSWSIKGYATEGGTRVVSFLNWKGIARQGQTSNAFLTVADVTPTFLDLAGIPHAGTSFGGKTVRPITGKSWAPFLAGKAERVYGAEDAVGTELFGSRAIRQGDWKITDAGDAKWRLFNLAEDPGETNDLSLAEPDRLKSLVTAWDAYAARVGVILPSEAPYRP